MYVKCVWVFVCGCAIGLCDGLSGMIGVICVGVWDWLCVGVLVWVGLSVRTCVCVCVWVCLFGLCVCTSLCLHVGE